MANFAPSPLECDPGTSGGNEEPYESLPSLSEKQLDESIGGTAEEPVEVDSFCPLTKQTDEEYLEVLASIEDIAANPNVTGTTESYNLAESMEQDTDKLASPPGIAVDWISSEETKHHKLIESAEQEGDGDAPPPVEHDPCMSAQSKEPLEAPPSCLNSHQMKLLVVVSQRILLKFRYSVYCQNRKMTLLRSWHPPMTLVLMWLL